MTAASVEIRKRVRPIPSDLEEVAREAVQRSPGLKLSAVKKSLPVSHQPFWKEAQACLRALAEAGSLGRIKKGNVELIFPGDPETVLEREVALLVQDQALDTASLKVLLAERAPGYELALDGWLKRALGRGALFEHPGRRYGSRPFVPHDLEAVARDTVSRLPGVKLAALKKSLPVSYQAFAKEVQVSVRLLASKGEIFLWKKGKSEHAFPGDPSETLDREARALVGEGSLDKAALKARVSEKLPGYEVVFDEWLERALAQGVLFAHRAQKGKGKSTRFGSKPDLARLEVALEGVRELVKELEATGVDRAHLLEIVAATLGLGAPVAAAAPLANQRSLFVSALSALSAEHPRQAMLSVRELRPRVPLGKSEFDRLALDLMREGAISLHHHDHAAALPEAERLQFVQDRGTYFNGIALRRSE